MAGIYFMTPDGLVPGATIPGPAGRGVTSIARTSSTGGTGPGTPGSTDTYTITYSDATTSTFTVVNGSNGTNGTGTITSVNGYTTPSVTLTASDVGAAPTARTISAGTGLTGGGDLTANRTLSVDFGTTATTVAAGNHTHTGVYQPLDTDLTAIAALVSAADKVPYATGAGTWALATQTAFARTLLDDPDAATARTTLGITAADYSPTLTGSSGTETVLNMAPTINQSGTANYSILKMDVTETAIGSGGAYNLLDLGVNGSQVFAVSDIGRASFTAPSSGSTVLSSLAVGDTFSRWTSRSDGQMRWGSGAAALDVTLQRSAASTLQVVGTLNATVAIQDNGSRVYSPSNKPGLGDIGASAFIQTLLDDADAATARTTLGVEPVARTFNAQTGTTYTLVLADATKVITVSNTSAITLTVPPNSSVAFPVGTYIEITNINTGDLTLAPGAGVTLNSPAGLKVTDQWGTVGLRKSATDTWTVMGRTST